GLLLQRGGGRRRRPRRAARAPLPLPDPRRRGRGEAPRRRGGGLDKVGRMILDRFRLAGKVAVVTGAGRGLGQAMALGLAEAGAELFLVSKSDGVEETRAK